MGVVLARIDDRLLHGQVIEGWAPYVQAETIVVVNDAVSHEKDRCQLMQLITPEHITLEVIPLAELEGLLKRYGKTRVLLLFAGLEDVLAVTDKGIDLGSINIGNLHNIRGGIEVTPSVFLNSRDMKTLRSLISRGVRVQAREVPDGPSLDLAACLQEADNPQ